MLLLAPCLALAAVLGAAGCKREAGPAANKKQGGTNAPPVPVVIAKSISKDMPVRLHAIGNVQASSTVTVRSQVSGLLTKVHFKEGEFVKEGDVLFTIDQRPFAGALETAKANLMRDSALLDNAKLEFDRTKKLFEGSLVSRDEFEKAEAGFKSLEGTVLADRAGISNATLNFSFTTIRAPIGGRTGNLLKHEGNVIKAQDDELVVVNRLQPIFISFGVPEQYLPEIRQRIKEAELTVEASYVNLNTSAPEGKLTFLDNSVDPTTGMIQLKATFPNQDEALWPGQFVQATLRLNERPGSVVVPSQAIQSSQKGEFVYVVKTDHTVEMRTVKPGLIERNETVIEGGLKAGETVVIDGQLRLVPGAKIAPKESLEGTNPVALEGKSL